MLLFHALPESVQDQMWVRLLEQTDDRRYADGLVEFKSRRPKPRPRPRLQPIEYRRDDTDALTSIPAETYLEILAPESEPGRGRCRCPLPDHEDRNPSASYRESVWYCHRCGAGGGIFQLGSALSGLADRGDEFPLLKTWVAERLLGTR